MAREVRDQISSEFPGPSNSKSEAGRARILVKLACQGALLLEQINPLRKEFGLPEITDAERIEYDDECAIKLPSAKYPQESWRIGSWRSAYNASGFNNILHMLTGKTLYDIIPESLERKGMEFQLDWYAARSRAQALLEELQECAKLGYSVVQFPPQGTQTPSKPTATYGNMPEPLLIEPREEINHEHAALEHFLQEKRRYEAASSSFTTYYNSTGMFLFGEQPLRVVGLMLGKASNLAEKRKWISEPYESGLPATYLIIETDDQFERYVQRLEIVLETINWVLDQPDIENYYLRWCS